MKRSTVKTFSAAFAVAMLAAGCGDKSGKPQSAPTPKAMAAADPLTVALAFSPGTNRTDLEIRQRQDQIRAGRQTGIALERLGWLYIAKARETFDAGFYKLAEQCALALARGSDVSSPTRERDDEGVAATQAAKLLRAHALQNLHRFAEAEAVARELVTARGLALDYGVLGDALMEQGKLDEAVIAYQQMADLNPDSQAATRAAHVRWLKGDLAGAIAMLEQAASAVDSRDAEMAAWIFTRLASLKWQAAAGGSLSDAQLGEGELSAASTEIRSLLGSHTQTGRRKDAVPSPGGEGQGDAGRSHTIPDFTAAQRDLETALALRSNYPPALLLHGKMLLAENKFSAAIEPLRLAEQQNPLPEYQWALIDALLSAGQSVEAGAIEARLKRTGAATDPRSFALFLATRGEQPTLALRLALEELTTRADVFTHDAVAWTQLANGNVAEAQRHMDRALAAGTSDPRLFLHAAIIASRAGPPPVVAGCVQKSSALAHLLLPSERKQLATITALLPASPVVVSLAPTPQASSVGGK